MGTSAIQRQQLRQALDELSETINGLKAMLDGLEAADQGNGIRSGGVSHTAMLGQPIHLESLPNASSAGGKKGVKAGKMHALGTSKTKVVRNDIAK